MVPPKVSVVIVSYNTVDKLRRCLGCVEPEHETVVVDNASTDGSSKMVRNEFPHVRLIENSENRGFGAANNQGCDSATGDYVLFLNSDAYADPGAIRLLADECTRLEAAGAGGKLLNPDGSLQESTANHLTLWAVFCEQTLLEKAFLRSPFLCPYWTTRGLAADETPKPTPQVMGACLLVKAEAGQPLEKFDERYFLYCEDTDLCKRLERHGEIVYIPSARFVHDLGSSSKGDPWKGIARYNAGKELYFRTHHGALASAVCWLLNRSGALLRLTLWTLKWNRSQMATFWRVLTSPVQGPTRS
jgi:hypothetical protein